MAYQNVGTPRFYIDQIQYLNSMGVDYEGFDPSLFTLDPITPKLFLEQGDNYHKDLIISANLSRIINRQSTPGGDGGSTGSNYLAILNHNIGLGQTGAPGGVLNDNSFRFGVINNYDAFESMGNKEEVLNFDTTGWNTPFDNLVNGCSILLGALMPNIYTETTTIRFDEVTMQEDAYAGALSIGTYYDMPHSPDLDLSMTIEFDGYDSVQTLGGSTLTNVRYSGSPWWFDKDGNQVEPWSVGLNPPYQPITITKRTGRRNWNLKFSYISDKDLFAPNDMFNNYIQTLEGYTAGDDYWDVSYPSFYYRLGGHDSFIGQVLYKVGNGQKFIFQPDNTNNNPDQFAICVLDQSSLSIKQVAYKVYDISLKIREVW